MGIENQNEKADPRANGMSLMPPEVVATDRLAREMADAAFLHDADLLDMTSEELKKRHNQAYMLARNSLENALGFPEPYAEDYINSQSPEPNRPNQPE